jgi:hypothetical protein
MASFAFSVAWASLRTSPASSEILAIENLLHAAMLAFLTLQRRIKSLPDEALAQRLDGAYTALTSPGLQPNSVLLLADPP